MSTVIARALAAAYPPPIRRQWGDELVGEIDRHGAWGWLDAASGALRLWLRPGQWPARSGGHLRRAIVVLAMITTGAAALGARELTPRLLQSDHVLGAVGLLVLIAGLTALLPLPRPTRPSVESFARSVIPPLLPALTMLGIVWFLSRTTDPTTGLHRGYELTLYWSTLVLCAAAPAIAVFRIDPDHAVIPGRQRASIGLTLILTGLASNGLADLYDRPSNLVVGFGIAQLALAAVTGAAILDLRRSHH